MDFILYPLRVLLYRYILDVSLVGQIVDYSCILSVVNDATLVYPPFLTSLVLHLSERSEGIHIAKFFFDRARAIGDRER